MTTAVGSQGRFGTAFEWLKIERAWRRSRGHAGVCIGIVDQGVQRDHPLLAPNLRRDHSTQMSASDADEIAGTQVAGVVAGRISERDQFSGVAPEARILPVRFALTPGPRSLDVAHAIEYAAEMGACVINVSHVADLSAPGVLRAIEYAATRDALVVCSARHALRPVQTQLPENLICVLALDERRQPLERCSAGAAHLAAPGFARVPEWRGTGAVSVIGASLGAAYVSGCAALIKSLDTELGHHQIKEYLLASAAPSADLRDSCRTGALLDVERAVLSVADRALTVP
jgi:membrane-anchored mycosin MYCP